jgi:hypothetical protein
MLMALLKTYCIKMLAFLLAAKPVSPAFGDSRIAWLFVKPSASE